MTISEALAILQGLYDRATDPALTHEEIDAVVRQIVAAFRLDPGGLRDVARCFGCRFGLTGRAVIARKLRDRIAERKGRWERGQEIARIARSEP